MTVELAIVAAGMSGLLVAAVVAVAWWRFGPGALDRRKRARSELWLDVHANYIRQQEQRRSVGDAQDRDAFEREVRRWD